MTQPPYSKFSHWHYAGRELVSLLTGYRQRLEGQLPKNLNFFGFNQQTIANRIAQILLSLNLPSFMDAYGEKAIKTGQHFKHQAGDLFDLDYCHVRVLNNGSIHLSIENQIFVKKFFKFQYWWLGCLLSVLKGALIDITTKSNALSLLLVMGKKDVLKNGKPTKFQEFCESGIVPELAQDGNLIVGTSPLDKTINSGRYIFSKHPFIELAKFSEMKDLPLFLKGHLFSFFLFL